MNRKQATQKQQENLEAKSDQRVKKPFYFKKRLIFPTVMMLATLGYVVPVPTRSAAPTLAEKKSMQAEAEKARIEEYIRLYNPRKSNAEHRRLVDAIMRESRNLKLRPGMKIDGKPVNPAYFITALIRVESTFKRRAISRADARGYMQLMMPTVAWMDPKLGTKTKKPQLFNTAVNVHRGVSYLNILIKEFGNTRKVCLAYNAGPGNVRRGFWVERYWTKVHRAYRDLQSAGTLVLR